MSREDGGPAFPTDRGEFSTAHEGMTLRDYFAAKAMQGICSVTGVDFGGPDGAARSAYKIADAMLATRKEETQCP